MESSNKHGYDIKSKKNINLPKILLVEDDDKLAKTITNLLDNEYDMEIAGTVTEALFKVKTKNFDLYVIDIILPDRSDRNGLDICKAVKENNENSAILVLTGKSAINYKLGAFNIGVDDYLCKPFNYLELRARLKALLNRVHQINSQKLEATDANTGTAFKLGLHDLSLDTRARLVQRGTKKINLRRREFDLLQCMLKNSGQVFSRDALIKGVWEGREINHNTVDVHVKNLREKIDDPFTKKIIQTIYGIGYKVE